MNETYDKIPAVRRSDLWELRKSPAHYLYRVTHEQEPTPALLFGTAAHKWILEPDTFWNEYALAPKVDRRTKAGKEAYAAWLEESAGKTAITEDDLQVIKDMDAAIMAHPTAAALLKTGYHEVSIAWTDTITGEACKCRPDVMTVFQGQNYIVDYKTTTSCEDGAFEYACRKYGYKLQSAMYTEGAFVSTLQPYRFAFVAQEKTPPYAVRCYFCDDGFLEEGQTIFRELIELYHKCKKADEWPGYEDMELYGDERN